MHISKIHQLKTSHNHIINTRKRICSQLTPNRMNCSIEKDTDSSRRFFQPHCHRGQWPWAKYVFSSPL